MFGPNDNRKLPRRLAPADTALLRRAFLREQAAMLRAHFFLPPLPDHQVQQFLDEFAPFLADDLGPSYKEWLASKGIDPATGAMTGVGIRFLKEFSTPPAKAEGGSHLAADG